MVSNVACRRSIGAGRESLRTPGLQRCGYALTVFLGAFLLFQVEPLISKRILPWFGGSPSVWTTCMLVFQLLLLAGYAYAHLVARISPRPQAILHLGALIVALGLLPVVPNPLWKPTGEENPLLRIALTLLVGLGAGTLAAYANGGDSLRFYEIDPDVLRIARKYFTFLDDCRGPWEVVLGDARLSLAAELARRELQRFDVLAIDAFSSDSIPLHLLTEEAAAVYLAHLAPDGVLAFHISNRNLDLQPVLTAVVRRYGLASRLVNVEARRLSDWGGLWVLTSRQPPVLAGVEYGGCPPLDRAKEVLWSDDYCSLANAVTNWSFAPAPAAHPRSFDAFDRGVAYLDKNDLDAAEAEFRKALAESDRDPFTWMRLGNTLRRKPELGEAARCYETAVRIDPNYADAYNNLAAVLASSDLPRALDCLRAAVRITPRNVEAHANLGSLLARQGNKDEAIRQYEIVLALNPRLPTVGQALAALKQSKTAIP
jgi:tetratricopeptide (TPR) repeat protein